MDSISGLRGPRALVGGLAHFGRMLDKIRLNQTGRLPPGFVPFLGESNPFFWDGRICRFLDVPYEEVVLRVKQGQGDDDLFSWALTSGSHPCAEEIEIMTAFICKRGWRDDDSDAIQAEASASGLPNNLVACRADLYDLEEGRPLPFPPDSPLFSGPITPSAHLPGLKSCRETVGGLVYFPRMVTKIRLHARGLLPDPWVSSLGAEKGFDGLCCRFLRVDYVDLAAAAQQIAGDLALMEWAYSRGRRPTAEQVFIWNAYLLKKGWRDAATDRLRFRLAEAGMPPNGALTMVDFIDLDEGRANGST